MLSLSFTILNVMDVKLRPHQECIPMICLFSSQSNIKPFYLFCFSPFSSSVRHSLKRYNKAERLLIRREYVEREVVSSKVIIMLLRKLLPFFVLFSHYCGICKFMQRKLQGSLHIFPLVI